MANLWGLTNSQNRHEKFAARLRHWKNKFSPLSCHDQSKNFAVSVQNFATSRISTSSGLSLWSVPSHSPTDLYLSYLSKPDIGAIYCFYCVNETGNIFYQCECTHIRFVANMAVKVRQVLVNWPVPVSPPSEDKKPTTMNMTRKFLPLTLENQILN